MDTPSRPSSWQEWWYDNAVKALDHILEASGITLSAEHRAHIVGEQVHEALDSNMFPFAPFMFRLLEQVGVSNPEDISREDARGIIVALRTFVEFGHLRWGIINLASETR